MIDLERIARNSLVVYITAIFWQYQTAICTKNFSKMMKIELILSVYVAMRLVLSNIKDISFGGKWLQWALI